MPEAPLTLPDLIRTIRAARTQAEERDLVQRESAKIRGAFRSDEPDARASNLAKLLYLHMLGYPAHFGQMECLKLVASPKYHEKRIGYLGAALLLDEKHDTHLLLTNSLKNDLRHPSAWAQGLALSALGTLGSAAMLRDLAGEVGQLARMGQLSVRRKAMICSVHLIRKVPDLTDAFIPVAEKPLTEQTQGRFLSTNLPFLFICLKYVSQLVGILRNLVVTGYSPDKSISGISDPFLQVQILRLLRILGRDHDDVSEAMNDSLAQVATNTETTRNVGNAILYETVLTIMGVQSTSGLRVWLNLTAHTYVALTSLQKLLQAENTAVQRHRATVLTCLANPDPTVKRRALQLSLALVNSSNVRTTTKELLAFLDTCSPDLKSDCASGIFLAAEKFAPNKRWHIDTVLQVLTMAGSYVRDDAVPNLIHLIGGAKELHGYAVQRLYETAVQDISQQPLVQVATWCIGEYGSLLLDGGCDEVEPKQVDPEEMLSLLQQVLQSHLSLPATRAYALTALMKLGTRLQDSAVNRIRSVVSIYCSCHDVELQQRAVEYNALFRKYDHLRYLVGTAGLAAGACGSGSGGGWRDFLLASRTPLHEAALGVSDLLDLLGEPTDPSPVQPSTAPPAMGSFLDLLQELKEPGTPLSWLTSPPSPPFAATTSFCMTVYEHDGLLVEFAMTRPPLEPTLLLITATVSNQTDDDIPGFSLQVAVPKSFQVELLVPSSSTVPRRGGSPITQLIRVLNPKKVSPREGQEAGMDP
uniref:AP-1 complex subunit gamma n=1 Tax=Varanus komodoensis TaxID=61221 RepID=A0A8D2LKF1_VARKO